MYGYLVLNGQIKSQKDDPLATIQANNLCLITYLATQPTQTPRFHTI
jgi:hypothetical protein